MPRSECHLIHGHSRIGRRSPEWNAYVNAKGRCTNPNDPRYGSYGKRGIEFRFKSFEEFLAAVGVRPPTPPGHKRYWSIDRIDNDGHYEAGNVRWTTYLENMRNRVDYRVQRRMLANAS